MMPSRLFLVLLALSSSVFVVVLVESATTTPFTPTRPCHEELARVSVAQIQEVSDLFLQSLAPSQAVASLARDNMFQNIQYDVVVSKVCGSCSSVFPEAATFLTPDATTSVWDKESYCFAGADGYDATHSSLVFAALDPDTDQIVTGETRGLLYRSGTQQTLEESPTEFFPICLSNYIQQHRNEDVLLALLDYLAPLVVASSGVIAVVPDTLGYGESHQYNRTYLLQDPSVAQAWTVSYLAAQQYIRNVTGGCTALASTTAVGGYGHGGYEAVLAAQGLEKLGISVFQLYVGGAVLNLPRQMGFLLQQLKSTATTTTNSDGIRSSSRNKYLESMTWMWAFSYSQQIGGVSLPSLASVGWRARILQLSAPNPEVPILYSNENLLDIIHPDIVDFFETARNLGSTNPCNGDVDSSNTVATGLCQLLAQHDITQVLLNINIPTKFCHSPEDNVVTIDNLPSANAMSINGNLQVYSPFLEFLKPTGDHFSGAVACALDPITTYRVTNKNQPLDYPPATCPSRAALPVCESLSPTTAPETTTMAPNDNSSAMRMVGNHDIIFMSFVGLILLVTT